MCRNVLSSIEKSHFYQDYISLLNSEDLSISSDYLCEKAREMCFNIDKKSKYIGSGCSRVAVSYNCVVLKIQCSKDNGNERERELIGLLKRIGHEDLLKHLCPILDSNQYINIVPYCEELPESYTEDGVIDIFHCKVVTQSLIYNIIDAFNLVGIEFSDVETPEQWGLYNGKLVLLDYAEWFYSE